MSEPHDIVPDGFDSEQLESAKAKQSVAPGSKRRRCNECDFAMLSPRNGSYTKGGVEHDYYCDYCKERRHESETYIGELDL